MKTLLITGAAGDIGTHLRRELAGRYGVSKVFGEALASLYADK